MGKNYITKQGLEKLKEELEHLKKEKMPDVIERIAIARDLGDLSENAEYQDAKDEQGFIAGRIVELENLINKSEVIKEDSGSELVNIGSTVTARCNGKEVTYTIVGSNEASPSQGLISNESPIGQAFLGAKVGDKVNIEIPSGEMDCEVLQIN